MQLHPTKLLYQDQSALITENQITIKNNFLSITFNKIIPFHQISDVFLLNKSAQDSSQIKNYFTPFNPFSTSNKKTIFIELWLKNSSDKPAFSPQNPQQVLSIIQSRLRHEQFKENVNLGVDHMKKSVQSGYGELLTKLGKFVEDTSITISKKGHQLSQHLVNRANGISRRS